jgi:DNA adenine methylase
MKPILKYPGAKWALASWIVRYLPETPHYVEPFCGSAAVYFNLPWKPRHAVLNDLSGDIVNLFRVIRERGDELAALVEMTPWAREEYERSYEPCDDPLERARRFLVRTWMGMKRDGLNNISGWRSAGTTGQRHNGGAKDYPAEWRQAAVRVRETAEGLRYAEIDNTSAIKAVSRHNAADVLIYADPPYPFLTRTHTSYYAHEMTDADHIALLDVLDAHPGPVALSGYGCALYDDRLPHWRRVTTQAQAEKGNTRTEVLWLNPVLQDRLSLGPLFAGIEATP